MLHLRDVKILLFTMDGVDIFIILLFAVVTYSCNLSEYSCDNGNCIALNKYCDGTHDCEDKSDEPSSCSNCNRTYFGIVGYKYPLRMTEPFQRHLSYFCRLTFVANGEEYGDLVELNFLSFQVGTFLIDSSHTSKCQQGNMKLTEKRATHRKRSQWSAERLRMPSLARARPREHERENPEFGYFCGSMPTSTSFYSQGNYVSLVIAMPTLVSVHSFQPSLYLTYKFLKSPKTNFKDYFGDKIPGTYCHYTLTNCHERNCKIESPNYPGFYLRNITCNYLIHQEKVVRGQIARIVISQKNDYKINLYSGYTDTGGYTLATLTSECAGDVIRILDGPSPDAPVLAQFCGSGQLPEVISSGPEVLVQLISAPYQVLHNSKLQLEVTVRYVRSNELTANSKGTCLFLLDGHRNLSGVIYSPRHTMPPNTTCSYHFRGGTAFDRVWLYFLSYYVPDLQVWNQRESCDVTQLEIYDPFVTSRRSANSDTTLIGRYCEKTFPRMCPHAVDYNSYIPIRPCNLTAESYLSTGPELVVKYKTFQSLDFMSQKSTFLARYEFVNTMQTGYSVNNSACDRRFVSKIQPAGSLGSPLNVFLYGRGGTKHLKCRYQFKGLPTEKLEITLKRVNLGHCHSFFDNVTLRHSCGKFKGRQTQLLVTENWHGVHLDAGCVCGQHMNPQQPVTIETFGSDVEVILIIRDMTPLEDFKDYYFEATYKFLSVEPCGGTVNDTKKELMVTIGNDMALPKRCRWLIQARPLKHLYLKVGGRKAENDCNNGNRYLLYSGELAQLLATVCAETADNRTTYDVFSLTWTNSSKKIKTDKIVVDMIATRPGTFSVQWFEVIRPSVYGESGATLRNKDCVYECPELNACISADLWCDGTIHCPSGSDEVPEECARFPTVYVSVGVSIAFIVILVVTLVLAHKWCRYNNIKGHPSSREEIQMSTTTPGTRIGERLSV